MADTEENVLASIEAAVDESIAASEGESYGSEPSEALAAGEISAEEESIAPPSDPQPAADQSKQTDTGSEDQRQQQPEGDRRASRLSYDDNGNIVDASGKVVVHAGGERRVFEQAQRLRMANERLEGEVVRLRQEAERTTALGDLPRQYNLSDDNVKMGLELVRDFIQNPVAAAQSVIRAAMQAGHNLGDIVGPDASGGSNLDMAAISKMIDEKLGVVNQDVTERKRIADEAEFEAGVRREYEEFLSTHDNANVHENVIAGMMERARDRGQTKTATEAYWELRAWTQEQGLDFARPLHEQVDEQGNKKQAPAPAANNGAPPSTLPSGRSANGATDLSAPVTESDPDADWDAIVGEELRRVGYNV